MGNSVEGPRPYSWHQIGPPDNSIQGFPSLICDLTSGLKADCYELQLQESVQLQAHLAQKRLKLGHSNILKLIDAKITSKNDFCNCATTVKIITEKILSKYSEVKNISEQLGFYILEICIFAYQELVEFAGGYFSVSSNMIGWNENRELRLWLNPNFGESNTETCSRNIRQSDMIREIILIVVNSLCQFDRSPFFKEMVLIKSPTFLKVKKCISQCRGQFEFVAEPILKERLKHFFAQTERCSSNRLNKKVACSDKRKHLLPNQEKVVDLTKNISFFMVENGRKITLKASNRPRKVKVNKSEASKQIFLNKMVNKSSSTAKMPSKTGNTENIISAPLSLMTFQRIKTDHTIDTNHTSANISRKVTRNPSPQCSLLRQEPQGFVVGSREGLHSKSELMNGQIPLRKMGRVQFRHKFEEPQPSKKYKEKTMIGPCQYIQKFNESSIVRVRKEPLKANEESRELILKYPLSSALLDRNHQQHEACSPHYRIMDRFKQIQAKAVDSLIEISDTEPLSQLFIPNPVSSDGLNADKQPLSAMEREYIKKFMVQGEVYQ